MATSRAAGLVAFTAASALLFPISPASASGYAARETSKQQSVAGQSVVTGKSVRKAMKLRGPAEWSWGEAVPLHGKVPRTRGKRVRVKLYVQKASGWKRKGMVRTNSRGKFRLRIAVATTDQASFRASAKLKRRQRLLISKTLTVNFTKPDSSETPPSPTSQPRPNNETNKPSTPDSDSPLTEQELRMVKLVNKARASGRKCGQYGYYDSVPPLAANKKLSAAAQAHSDDMATNNFFSHTGDNGSQPSDRLKKQGYLWSSWGENIAAGYPDAAAATQGLIDSPGHCKNLMNPTFTEIGVGVSTAKSGYGIYWTQNFGSPRR